MTYFNKQKILRYTATDLYELVLDVDKYKEFLPGCSESRILSINENIIIAELAISYKGYEEKYRSKITHSQRTEGAYEINVEAISGPFKFLNNKWKFSDLQNGCLVEFTISFEFKNLILNKLMGMFFKSVVEKTMASFEARADSKLTSLLNQKTP